MSKYAIVDLEMCKVPKAMRNAKYHWASETIQIGAVLVDENLEIVDEFNTYVHPEYGAIDGFIRRLTGITQYDIKDACTMKEALQQFAEWVPKDAVCVSWSDTDEHQIRHEMQGKDIENSKLDELLDNWQDCQKTFGERMNSNRAYSLAEALIAADIIYDDNAHNGLVDAKNTAMLFIKMMREPELVLNEYYVRSKEEAQRDVYSLASICPGLELALA